ncbi:transporter substrate-binding domain-containing protein [Hahella sp. CR1]|uniref:substrate-binding periplasmic protein n=1 Tax=Hahella sp. CR1 TaxID=2992807 RepID=UPI00244362FC|nr:transporter substrate-binding domain-containing protein [Hahella sp. CR1]MDG9666820.1 transporter substrate-binding domain-containing protein [Hahella sp. CR1]
MHKLAYVLSMAIFTVATALSSSHAVATDVYVHPKIDLRFHDVLELLKSALEATTEKYGPYELRATKADLIESRTLSETEKNRLVNIAWSSTSIEKEARLRAIRIPLRKGILGYRISLVTDKGQKKLRDVESLDALRALKVGQGEDWGDVAVYKHNKVKVLGVFQYNDLFTKLARNRYDLFPRGINEAFDELAAHQKDYPNLKIEEDILLYYPWPYYFFMSKDNERLAQRVEDGLNKLIADGRFDKIFQRRFGDDIARAHIKQRRIIYLDNPMLPADTPLQRKELWFRPEDA